MEKELSLREIINEVILFFIRYRKIIITTTITGFLVVVLFQKFRPAFYNTKAIVTSGISIFERADHDEFLDQSVAINLINLLQLDVKNKDYSILSDKMNISIDHASSIKSIIAKDILRKNKDEKEIASSKFSIDLSLFNNSSIDAIEQGLLFYFKNNNYFINYYEQFLSTTQNEINAIDKEVVSLRKLRQSENSKIDVSSLNVNSRKSKYSVNNQILELINLRSKNTTDLTLLQPLIFVAPFTNTENPERGVLMIGSIAAAISFLLGIFIAVFRNVYVSSKKL